MQASMYSYGHFYKYVVNFMNKYIHELFFFKDS